MQIHRLDDGNFEQCTLHFTEETRTKLRRLLEAKLAGPSEGLFVAVSSGRHLELQNVGQSSMREISRFETYQDTYEQSFNGEGMATDHLTREYTTYVVYTLGRGGDVLVDSHFRFQWSEGNGNQFEDPDWLEGVRLRDEKWRKKQALQEEMNKSTDFVGGIVFVGVLCLLYFFWQL